jgi:uncharacterized membrane protein
MHVTSPEEKMPDTFWYCLGWAAAIIVLALSVIKRITNKKKGLPQPKIKTQPGKYDKLMCRICYIFVISLLLLLWAMMLPVLIGTFFYDDPLHPEIQQELRHLNLSVFFMNLTWLWAPSAIFISFLPYFQNKITTTKRCILLLICLMPFVFALISQPFPDEQNQWYNLKFALLFACPACLLNAPAVIFGKPFVRFVPELANKFWHVLKLD